MSRFLWRRSLQDPPSSFSFVVSGRDRPRIPPPPPPSSAFSMCLYLSPESNLNVIMAGSYLSVILSAITRGNDRERDRPNEAGERPRLPADGVRDEGKAIRPRLRTQPPRHGGNISNLVIFQDKNREKSPLPVAKCLHFSFQ